MLGQEDYTVNKHPENFETKIDFAKHFINFIKLYPPTKDNIIDFQNAQLNNFFDMEIAAYKKTFTNFLKEFPLSWAPQEYIDLYSNYFLNNPVSFMDFYSIHLNNLTRSKLDPNFATAPILMKNFYEEYTGSSVPGSKLLFFNTLSHFLSNQENEKLEKDDNLKQMQKHFNELKRELFITPLAFKFLQEKFNIYFSKQDKQDIFDYFRKGEYITIDSKKSPEEIDRILMKAKV